MEGSQHMHVYIIRWRESGRLLAVIDATGEAFPTWKKENAYRNLVLENYCRSRGLSPEVVPTIKIEYSPVISMREALATD